MIQIAIIGAGQIGSRHLQAMSLIDRPVRLQVVDPSAASRQVARERFEQCPASPLVTGVDYLEDIAGLHPEIDVAIVATSANIRRATIESLLSRKVVRRLILEKVLFQKVEDLAAVGQLLREKGVAAWVNCPNRMAPIYKTLKDSLRNEPRIEVAVTGSMIGIGCNAIHYLDLCAFLAGTAGFALSPKLLDKEIMPSKRDGFVEFTGTLAGSNAQGTRFSVTSLATGDLPVLISIASPSLRCIVRENEAKCWLSEAASGWAWREEAFTNQYQSQISQIVVRDLLDRGDCDLTRYEDSVDLHVSLLTALRDHLDQQHLLAADGACPIT